MFFHPNHKEKKTMNEELKARLQSKGEEVYNVFISMDKARADMEQFSAAVWTTLRNDGQKRTEKDMEHALASTEGFRSLSDKVGTTRARYESVKSDMQCLLAEVSLTCAEMEAASRVAR